MPILIALRTTLNTALTAVRSRIDTYQSTYVAVNGRYWQGLMTPAVVPQDGVLADLDMTLRPTDQVEDWRPLSLAIAKSPISIACHVHDGPLGKGYTVYATAVVAGDLWTRAIGVGPHSATFDWTQHVVKS